MGKLDTNVKDLVGMIQRGELRLPEMQRRYVWRAPRVRDLIDSLYRGHPSGSILVWETDEAQPRRDMAVEQHASPFSGHKLLLDGQQRLTSLSAILRGEPIKVRGKRKPIDILFNLEHPEGPGEFTEVVGDEDSPLADDDEPDDDDGLFDSDDGDLTVQERLKRATFVVSSKNLAALPPRHVRRSAAARTRAANQVPLNMALHKLLKGRTMSVSEAAEAVQQAGYKSNAANFQKIVNLTLLKRKDLFKRVGRGQYTAK